MKLLVVRHAIAENREDYAEGDDAARPLTPDGRKKLTKEAEIQVGLSGLHGAVAPTPLGPNWAAPEIGSARAACQLASKNCCLTAFVLIGRFR